MENRHNFELLRKIAWDHTHYERPQINLPGFFNEDRQAKLQETWQKEAINNLYPQVENESNTID